MLVAACVQVARTSHVPHVAYAKRGHDPHRESNYNYNNNNCNCINKKNEREKTKLQLTNANCRRSAFFQLVLHIRLHTEDSAGLRVRITPMSEPQRGSQGNPIPSHDIENSKRIETASASTSASQA